MRGKDEALSAAMEEALFALLDGPMTGRADGFWNGDGPFNPGSLHALCQRGLASARPPFGAKAPGRQVFITTAGIDRAEALLRDVPDEDLDDACARAA